jgi:hypothetical protein
MSSVWDDAASDENVDLEEATPLPEGVRASENPLPISPEKLETLAAQILEKVAREIVPEMAERIIREKIDEMLKENE